MGVEEDTVGWFRSYLSGRRQSCTVDGQVSAALNIPSCGVPQGSIGGPILWLLFTCDQPDVIHEHGIQGQDPNRGCGVDGRQVMGLDAQEVDEHDQVKCGELVGYVDDGAYTISDKSSAVLSEMLTKKFKMLEQWMHANKLVINPDKTHLIVMGSKKHKNTRMGVNVNASGHIITPTETEKLLGGSCTTHSHRIFTLEITRGHYQVN